jgi:hypothetical protein
MHYTCGIADGRHVRRHALRHDSAHADYGAPTNDQWLTGRSLLQYGPTTNVGVILNHDVAIALCAWRERYEIPDDAIVLDVAV